MDLKIPYDELTLKVALLGASNKLEADSGLQERLLEKISQNTAKSMAEFNTRAAEYHGISQDAFINSSNYETMKAEYGNHCISLIHGIYKDSGFEDKEAWALICVGFGKLID